MMICIDETKKDAFKNEAKINSENGNLDPNLHQNDGINDEETKSPKKNQKREGHITRDLPEKLLKINFLKNISILNLEYISGSYMIVT